jgi:TetR/AcrR family transcriptional regulator, cholesterol catabolism regulator
MRHFTGAATNAADSKRAEIIDVAIQIFAVRGYKATNLNDVAGQLGITKATIYYYFRNKEDILKAILEKSMDRMNKVLSLENSPLSPRDKLRIFIQSHTDFSSDGIELARITFDQVNEIPRKLRLSLKSNEKKIDALLQDILREGMETGVFTVKDVKLTSYMILGMCNWTYHWYNPEGRLTSHRLTEKYIHLIENGYLKPALYPERRSHGHRGVDELMDGLSHRLGTEDLPTIISAERQKGKVRRWSVPGNQIQNPGC